jgi:hypothetical protein
MDVKFTKNFIPMPSKMYQNCNLWYENIPSGNPVPGANPTIVSYNASAVKIYNATSSIVRFENKIIIFFFAKKSL